MFGQKNPPKLSLALPTHRWQKNLLSLDFWVSGFLGPFRTVRSGLSIHHQKLPQEFLSTSGTPPIASIWDGKRYCNTMTGPPPADFSTKKHLTQRVTPPSHSLPPCVKRIISAANIIDSTKTQSTQHHTTHKMLNGNGNSYHISLLFVHRSGFSFGLHGRILQGNCCMVFPFGVCVCAQPNTICSMLRSLDCSPPPVLNGPILKHEITLAENM